MHSSFSLLISFLFSTTSCAHNHAKRVESMLQRCRLNADASLTVTGLYGCEPYARRGAAQSHAW